MCLDEVLLRSELPLTLKNRGKVRELYELEEADNRHCLLLVASDRISAFDCILPTGIPCKGRVLTQMSTFWFKQLRNVVPSHLVTAHVEEFPASLRPYRAQLEGRSMVVRRADMVPVECVARGYLAGSGWKEYQASGAVCGIALPPGLRDGDQLPEPIFTPAMKAQAGHDQNVSFEYVANEMGAALAERLRELTVDIYRRAAAFAEQRGILLADTKFEFGFIDGQLCLADEVLTPDSSRWWPAATHRPGGPQLSFDKQFVRDYLETVAWNKQPPAPPLPPETVRQTSEKYLEAFQRITGRTLTANSHAAV